MTGEFRTAVAEETERMLSAARRTLADARGDAERAGAEGAGEAFNGLARARLGPDGTVAELLLDPRLLRLPAVDLAEGVREAVNQALRAGRAAADTRARPIDLATLDAEVAELQTQGLRRLAEMGEFMDDFLRRAARR